MIQAVVNRALSYGFRCSAFYSAMDKTEHKCVPEAPSFDKVATKLVDAHTFTVSVAQLIKYEIEKNSLDKSRMEERFVELTEEVR